MNTKAVVLTVLLSLLLVPCLLDHRTVMAAASTSTPTAHIKGLKIPIGVKDPTCLQPAHDSCTKTKKCCTCKAPEFNNCYTCCLA
ncbi:hypothetical protein LINGRAHAP2_LOCUS33637 [Linum grandiflorum]